MTNVDHPTVELTSEQRMRWGTCPVCRAEHGQPCDHMVGFPLGMNVHGGRPAATQHLWQRVRPILEVMPGMDMRPDRPHALTA